MQDHRGRDRFVDLGDAGNIHLRGFFVAAVRGPDGDRQSHDARLLHEFYRVIDFGVHEFGDFLFRRSDVAQLTFDRDSAGGAEVHDLFGLGGVFLEREGRTVEHDPRAAVTQSAHDRHEARPVVQVEADRHFGLFSPFQDGRSKVEGRAVLEQTGVRLNDDRRLGLFSRVDDPHGRFHVVGVEGRDREGFRLGNRQNVFEFNEHFEVSLKT